MSSVGVEECPADIDDRIPAPVHDQASGRSDNSHLYSFQILLRCIFQEFIHILRSDDTGHSLLGLRDRKFGPVKTRIFFGYLIQIDLQSFGQLTDRDGDSAGAKVIALADQSRDLRSSEHTLQFSLGRRISLLDLSTADFDGRRRVSL